MNMFPFKLYFTYKIHLWLERKSVDDDEMIEKKNEVSNEQFHIGIHL